MGLVIGKNKKALLGFIVGIKGRMERISLTALTYESHKIKGRDVLRDLDELLLRECGREGESSTSTRSS